MNQLTQIEPLTLRAQYLMAIDICLKAHAKQKDLAGVPYALHPAEVSIQALTLEQKIIALLHDVIEDCPDSWTYALLRERGFSEEIIETLELLEFQPDIQTRDMYVRAIKNNPSARAVKLLDLKRNMDITRLPSLTDGTFRRLRRYHEEYKYLSE